jgi:hypothetical protein
VDDTGAALQALVAAGRHGSGPVKQGVSFLRSLQNADGGWGQTKGRSSNAQSTAWAVQGLVAAGVRLGSLNHDPIRFLVGLQSGDGHVRYSKTSNQTPVWVTAQALTAIRRRPFPLAAAPRGRRKSHKAAAKSRAAPAPSHRAPKRAATKPSQSAGTTMPVRPDPAPRRAVEPEAAASQGSNSRGHGTSVPVPLVGGALAAVLAILWLLRRRLGLSLTSLTDRFG